MLVAVLGVAATVLLWHFVGYPLVVGTAAAANHAGASREPTNEPPTVAVVVTVYNEADAILDRIRDCYEQDYPQEHLEIVVASDGSDDGTVERVRSRWPGATVVENEERNKAATRSAGVAATDADVLLFTDARTRFQPGCIAALVRQFADPAVGVVGGVLTSEDFEEGGIGETMGAYWRWEYALRRAHSELGLLPKLSGAIVAVRRDCYDLASPHVDVDQVAGFEAVRRGYEVRHEPAAIATERFPTDPSGEFQTRRRLTAQACTALWQYRDVLDPRERPLLFASTVSYWHLRYLTPWLLLAVAATSGVLATTGGGIAAIGGGLAATDGGLTAASTAGLVALAACLCGVGAGIAGAALDRLGVTLQPFSGAFAFLVVQAGILVGTVEFLLGRRINSYGET